MEIKNSGQCSQKFYQKNTVAVVCDEVHTSVHW